jgi:hypothetical protein
VVHDLVQDVAPGSQPPMDFDLGGDVPVLATALEPSPHLDAPAIDDVPVLDTGTEDHWGHAVVDDQLQHHDDPGMDLFT